MPIKIYTYQDPYKMDTEPYWGEITNCPYFCASQTLVNGLRSLYRAEFQQGRVTTVKNLIDSIFEQWESTACIVRQHADLDNLMRAGMPVFLQESQQQNLVNVLNFNRESLFESIRIMAELNMNPDEILMEQLTMEQQFVVTLYKKIMASEKCTDFVLETDLKLERLDEALIRAMQKARDGFDASFLKKDRVVIHGVHQFTPIMLRAIEELARYKEIILLFHYQPQYKNVYQTWINIYSAFDGQSQGFVGTNSGSVRPNIFCNQANLLADRIGRLMEGKLNELLTVPFDVIEFDNMTEFADYAANIFERAERVDPSNPMRRMSEQIYAADSSVNNILKVYFPEQFGERKFLDYPLGHFFLAIANMWDIQNNKMVVTDPNDLKECFNAGILKEEYTGQLYSIFKKAESAFNGCRTIKDMLKRLEQINRNTKRAYHPETQEFLSHVLYYNLSNSERTILKDALTELEELASYFYEDFEKQPHNFKNFYKRLKRYLQEDIVDARRLNEEFSDIVHRVLERLNEVEDIDASASFECLKSTMAVYLTQEVRPEKSAHWIVRNFEQIDGDILRSKVDATVGGRVYHFACLSDEDLNTVKEPEFPWPLDDAFFEIAQNPVDWKYQVYVNARRERKNFRRYALLYGLEFDNCDFKLSYVKQDREKDQELYYALKILGAHIVPYREMKIGEQLAAVPSCDLTGVVGGPYNEFDYSRYKICKYRFLLETIVEGNSVYKDSFLLTKYLEILLENSVRERCEGYPVSETLLQGAIDDSYEELKKYFPFVLVTNQVDMFWNIRKRLMGTKAKIFPGLTNADRREMMLRELFIFKQLKDPKENRGNVLQGKFDVPSLDSLKQIMSADVLRQVKFEKSPDVWCQYCSNRDICVACYAAEKL